jgi:hypothetical protein
MATIHRLQDEINEFLQTIDARQIQSHTFFYINELLISDKINCFTSSSFKLKGIEI